MFTAEQEGKEITDKYSLSLKDYSYCCSSPAIQPKVYNLYSECVLQAANPIPLASIACKDSFFPRIFACGTLLLLHSASTSLPLKNLCFGVNAEEWPTLRSCSYFFETSVPVLLLRRIVVCFSADFSVLNDSGVKL